MYLLEGEVLCGDMEEREVRVREGQMLTMPGSAVLSSPENIELIIEELIRLNRRIDELEKEIEQLK